MSSRITLKDVARRAGVSYQTVSKVLRGGIVVRPETRSRIEAAVAELGYRPNVTARNLREQSSRLIGYSWKPKIPKRPEPILEEFLQSIVEAAELAGYHILLFPHHREEDQIATYRELVGTGRIDGFVLSDLDYEDRRVPLLQALNFPFVGFGRVSSDSDFPYVEVDGQAGVRAATEHLLALGHRRIAALGWPPEWRVGAERLAGFLQAMDEAGLAVDPALVIRGPDTFEFSHQQSLALLARPAPDRPTALVAVSDLMALGAMRAVRDQGHVVGRDVAVTGFDDLPSLRYLEPGVTTLRQPVWEVGQKVVALLAGLLEGHPLAPSQIVLKPELIVRGSSQGFCPS